jgi:hypothetical protein
MLARPPTGPGPVGRGVAAGHGKRKDTVGEFFQGDRLVIGSYNYKARAGSSILHAGAPREARGPSCSGDAVPHVPCEAPLIDRSRYGQEGHV